MNESEGKNEERCQVSLCVVIYVCKQEGGHSEKCMRCKQRATFKKDIQGER